ncbi:MAG: phage replisome organizer N-terminal domain-containing protein [Butyrivibrio sp.]|nr:phage replisome organizer N-terminal domain-containing protein [Butyrivibrio sp.]
MADVKWIKIVTDIFDDEKMFAIETQQDGQLMELIWFKLLCLAGKCNNHGFLMINNKIAYTDEMLASIFRVEIGSVQRALTLFEQLEMIEVVENSYMIANWDKYQNVQGLEDIRAKQRERTRKCREKQKLLKIEEKEGGNVTSNVTDTLQSNVTSSISISNSISSSLSNSNSNKESKNSNKEKKVKHKYGQYQNVLLTDDELDRLKADYGASTVDKAITFFDEYIEEKGYKSKSHNLAMRRWVFDAIKEREIKTGKSTGHSELSEWANA